MTVGPQYQSSAESVPQELGPERSALMRRRLHGLTAGVAVPQGYMRRSDILEMYECDDDYVTYEV